MKHTVTHKLSELPKQSDTDWKRVDALTEQQLTENAEQDLDSFIADEDFWTQAQLIEPKPHKERITLYLDEDVLNWLRHVGRGYQTRINKILRACMLSYQDKNHKKNK